MSVRRQTLRRHLDASKARGTYFCQVVLSTFKTVLFVDEQYNIAKNGDDRGRQDLSYKLQGLYFVRILPQSDVTFACPHIYMSLLSRGCRLFHVA